MIDSVYIERAIEFFSFHYAFSTKALVASLLIGVACGTVGTFLLLRKMALLGDAAGHATLPGVCAGFLAAGGAKSIGFLLGGALLFGLAAAVIIGVISKGPRTRSDAAIGIVLASFFGLGVVMLSYVQNAPSGAQSGLNSFLFGNIAGITDAQLWTISAIVLVLMTVGTVMFRWLTLSTFDSDFAAISGVHTTAVHYGLLVALTVAVVVSIEAVGAILVSAMLIIPAASALLVSKRIETALLLSSFIGAASGLLGAFFSYIFEGVSTGPAMAVVAATIFATIWAFRGARDSFKRRAMRRELRHKEVAYV